MILNTAYIRESLVVEGPYKIDIFCEVSEVLREIKVFNIHGHILVSLILFWSTTNCCLKIKICLQGNS